MEKDKIIEEYLRQFGEMPPADMVISFYDDFYINLMQEAIKNDDPITPETLSKALENEDYDMVGKNENTFKTFQKSK